MSRLLRNRIWRAPFRLKLHRLRPAETFRRQVSPRVALVLQFVHTVAHSATAHLRDLRLRACYMSLTLDLERRYFLTPTFPIS